MSIEQQIQDHIDNTNNPHNITKAMLGLGGVENYPIATMPEAETGNRNDRYLTPLRLKAVFDGHLKREGLMDDDGNPILPNPV